MKTIYHALKVDEQRCTGCTHCMESCPTQAIRVRDGHAVIDSAACVDCGMCLKSCPSRSIYVEMDDFKHIYDYKYRVVLLPPVLIGQFSEEITEEQIFAALHDLGFDYVMEVTQTCGIITEAVENYMEEHPECRPLISTYCPAVVRLIQVRFPSLISHFVPVRQAMELAAIYVRQRLLDEGHAADEIGVFYITPCAAKIAAIKSPVAEEHAMVDGVINIDFIYNKIQNILTKKSGSEIVCVPEQTHLPAEAIAWQLPGGEATHINGRCLAVDEMHNVIDILGKVENDELPDIDFLELRACDRACVGGALVVNNRFLTQERLEKRISESIQKHHNFSHRISPYHDYLLEHSHISRQITSRSIDKLDEDVSRAMEKMSYMQRLLEILPRIDCGACGAPSCKAFARDMVQGKEKMTHCVFMRNRMCIDGQITPEESLAISEEIWGKERFIPTKEK